MLVEQAARAAGLIRDNVRALGLDGCTVVHAPCRATSRGRRTPYDVVFLDPPYSDPATQVRADLAALVGRGWLRPGADVVVERSGRDRETLWPEGFEPGKVRSYGETALHPATWPG